MQITANIADPVNGRTFRGTLHWDGERITDLAVLGEAVPGAPWLLPGFVDAHVHIESSMLTPSEFARLAVVHGTVATVSDPHEIANVCGLQGVEFMIRDAARTPFRCCFGAPSCVPATPFETAGATLTPGDVDALLSRPEVGYLSEVMNFPGVLAGDEGLHRMIASARRQGKPADGHAPGLRGEALKQYIAAGISTDHECFTESEALEKLQQGMWVLIREGSAARNFDALAPLLHQYAGRMMFCSDDKHPDSLVEGHIDRLCARAVALGVPPLDVLQVACVNPVRHYGLGTGLLQPGDRADFILCADLETFKVLQTWIGGVQVAGEGQSFIDRSETVETPINAFGITDIGDDALVVWHKGEESIPVIGALDGQLITERRQRKPALQNGQMVADPQRDLLKIVVVNRYFDAPPAVAFIEGFGLKRGALASTVAHDSHNIVAVGTDDASLLRAVRALIAVKGGIALSAEDEEEVLPLPVAGLMSPDDGYEVARRYSTMDAGAKALGSALASPWMTLSFMALLVIPELKLSDRGLFDGSKFALM